MFQASRDAIRLIRHFIYNIIYNTMHPLFLHTCVSCIFLKEWNLIYILRFSMELLQCMLGQAFFSSSSLVKLLCGKQVCICICGVCSNFSLEKVLSIDGSKWKCALPSGTEFTFLSKVPSEKSLSRFPWLAALHRNVSPLQYCRGHLALQKNERYRM